MSTTRLCLFRGSIVVSALVLITGCGGIRGGLTPVAPANLTQNIAPVPMAAPIPMGVDYGLKKQCIRTPNPGRRNFYYDNVDCPGSTYPTSQYWTTAVGSSCTGFPPNQAMLINGKGSAVAETWSGDPSSGYTVELKTDYANVGNLCDGRTLTWVPFMDNWVGGGPLPRIDQYQLQFTTSYSRKKLHHNGATRAFAGVAGQWLVRSGAGPTLDYFIIEINFAVDEPAWGKKPGTPADVIAYSKPKSGNHTYFVSLWGAKLSPPIDVPRSKTITLKINWLTILKHLITDEKLFPPPLHGWKKSQVSTTAGYVGTEVANSKSKGTTGGPEVDLFVRNFRESELPGQ